MSENESWTVGRLLTWTTDYLKRQGSDTPRLDAEVLLATARGCQRIELYTAFNDPVADPIRTAFRDLVKRRAGGEPVAYLVGHREFYSLTFEVTSDVLIPRPETEDLVLRVLDRCRQWGGAQEPLQIADVGTGSGAIAVSVARHVPGSRVTATDISPAALEIARRNAARHQVAERIEFLCGDLLAPIPPQTQFALIASNPPYVSRSEWDSLKADIRDHEPYQALVGGETGTEVIARLIPQAADHLCPGGWLLLEISPMIETAVTALLQADPRLEAVSVEKDTAHLPRVAQARRTQAAE
jgi:release factor glutamine methyltransferase